MFGISDRPHGLIVHSQAPFNAEPHLDRLRRSFITATDDFYVRSHGLVPHLDPASHAITIAGKVGHPLRLTVADLKAQFSPRSVMATMQCAGNRRADLQQVRPTSGDPWSAGAIGNAEWTGVSLADVLRAAGAESEAAWHVAFEAADLADHEGAEPAPYGVSIPMSKAMSTEVLLAWGMNGEPLRSEHGAPLRVVVPGYAGVRSPKWLTSIRVQDSPSDAVEQRLDYRLFPSYMQEGDDDIACGTPINQMPLNAALCEPSDGAVLKRGPTMLRGYAIATERAVTRIEFSIDDGATWYQATIEPHDRQPWSWTFWSAEVTLNPGRYQLTVRAWDAAGQTQPSRPHDVWNPKGYLSAAWHQVRVSVE
ncbi:sulfite oxidase [Lichenihabitans sp. PAMC28606]|uniref:sulfite oxidase n=1 Tax=Lichenihabitans sp. PAMC28606 TaxID=2880932 RepID=UPI001D0A5839|nr:sulfite oxidase [Lichenihabitans sp. PAMC28606]UDL96207.1 sulfite oxidase [Lichenihabitans sp. PAMC28606]